MDETSIRLMEIAGHMDAITEQMKEDRDSVIKNMLLERYAIEIERLVIEMKTLLGLSQR